MSLIAMAVVMCAGATSYAVAQQRAVAADARLQELADHAALAGVNALAATEGESDASRLAAADAAVRKVIASRAEIVPIISPSIEELKMSVALTTSATGRGPALTATARYVPPGSSMSPEQTADSLAKRTRG